MSWQEDGVVLTAETSTSGIWVDPMSAFIEAFLAGGDHGQPLTWTGLAPASTAWTWVNYNVNSDSEFQMRSEPANTNLTQTWGAGKVFNVTPGHLYQVSVDIRGYSGRGPQTNPLLTIGRIKVGQANSYTYTNLQPYSSTGIPDSVNTYSLVTQLPAKADDGTMVDRFEIQLNARALNAGQQWGVYWYNLTITDTDSIVTGAPLTWQTVLCDTMHATVRYGRARFTERYDVGTFVVSLNNAKGSYTYHEDDAGFRPGRMFRMTATYKGSSYPICYGVIDRVQNTVELDGTATVILTVFDTTSFTSNTLTPNIWPYNYGVSQTGDMFYSGGRIDALLNYAGISKAVRAIDAGQWSMQPVAQSGRALREEIGITADSEGGAFYGERNGAIVYRDRTWSNVDPHGNSVQAQITAVPEEVNWDAQPDDIPTIPDATIICPFNLETDWSLERVINYIRLSVAGGSPYTFEDETSQKAYGLKSYQRLDFVNAKPLWSPSPTVKDQLTTRAADAFSTSLKAMMRVYSLAYRPNPDTWKFTLEVFLNWLVRVYYYHPTGDWGFSTVVRIQSVLHTISPRDWVTSFNVDQPIDFHDDLTPLPPSETGWDLGLWDLDIWDDVAFGANWDSGAKWDSGVKWGY